MVSAAPDELSLLSDPMDKLHKHFASPTKSKLMCLYNLQPVLYMLVSLTVNTYHIIHRWFINPVNVVYGSMLHELVGWCSVSSRDPGCSCGRV